MLSLQEWSQAGVVYVLLNQDTNSEIFFYADPQYSMNVESEFRTLWQEIKVPDEADLAKELSKGRHCL